MYLMCGIIGHSTQSFTLLSAIIFKKKEEVQRSMWLVILIGLIALMAWCLCVASSDADDKIETMFTKADEDEDEKEK